ncbi:MAG TPA: hypothetical protein VNZ57_08600, partial [Longimicrobiales bacterium]|nr:hypothetical protein [Longimicrobiales bacterium]
MARAPGARRPDPTAELQSNPLYARGDVAAFERVLAWTFVVGATGFSIGFFGPMILAPGANQGPLLGILITGPLGALLGLVIGVVQEVVGVRGSPADLLARRGLLSDGGRRVWRAVAALVAIVFLAGA